MPNYRYHTPESDRRGYCGCSSNMSRRNQQQSNTRPQRESCEVSYHDCDAAAEMSCAVKGHYDALGDMAIAMAYVPWQMWCNVLDAEKGLCCGTIFEDLNKPFCGTGGARK